MVKAEAPQVQTGTQTIPLEDENTLQLSPERAQFRELKL